MNLEEHCLYLFRIAYNMTGNVADAEDAVQEVCLRFLEKKPRVHGPVRSYLARMVFNYCVDRSRMARPVSLEDIAEPETILEENQKPDHELEAWLIRLEPKDRLVLDLFYYENLTLDEIAAIMNDSTGAVKVRLHRARKRLRNLAQKQKEGVGCGKS